MVEDLRENLDQEFYVEAVLTDLSEAFYYVLHDLLIGKLAAHGFDDSFLLLIYSYLKSLIIMSQNGQTHCKNLAAFAARFLKCVRPSRGIMH